jgi:hypothetical protein
MNGSEVLTEVAKNTDSSVVLIAVVIAAVIILIAIPMYRMMSKKDLEKFDKYTQREGQIIQVVKENTAAISKLTQILEVNNRNCETCKAEQTSHWIQTNSKLDVIMTVIERRKSTKESREENG